MFEFLRQQFDNQFMTGGLVIIIFTALLAYLRNIPSSLWRLLKRRFVLVVDVADHDQAFFWIQEWLAEQPYSKKSTLLTASTRVRPTTRYEVDNEDKIIEVSFSPAPGFHLLRFKKHWILLIRVREKKEGFASSQFYRELFTFQTLARDRQIIIDLIEEARLLAFPPDEKAITVFKDLYNSWRAVMQRAPRPLASVVLQDNIAEEVLGDVNEFLESADWYQQHGVPYQRGYLLYGPPGNGKTSLVHAIASELERDIYILRVSATTDDAIQDAMSRVSENGIVLLEDIDCAAFAKSREEDEVSTKVMKARGDTPASAFLTLSGFLNAIDGISAHEGRLLFMTTNHKDSLDPALIRPGRIDREFCIDNASQEQAERLFLQFFPGKELEAKRFAAQIREPVCMAALQGNLIRHKNDPAKAAEWRGSQAAA